MICHFPRVFALRGLTVQVDPVRWLRILFSCPAGKDVAVVPQPEQPAVQQQEPVAPPEEVVAEEPQSEIPVPAAVPTRPEGEKAKERAVVPPQAPATRGAFDFILNPDLEEVDEFSSSESDSE